MLTLSNNQFWINPNFLCVSIVAVVERLNKFLF